MTMWVITLILATDAWLISNFMSWNELRKSAKFVYSYQTLQHRWHAYGFCGQQTCLWSCLYWGLIVESTFPGCKKVLEQKWHERCCRGNEENDRSICKRCLVPAISRVWSGEYPRSSNLKGQTSSSTRILIIHGDMSQVLVDVLSVFMEKAEVLTLEICYILIPLLRGLLSSDNDRWFKDLYFV